MPAEKLPWPASKSRNSKQRRLGGDERRVWKLVVELFTQAKKLAREGEAATAADTLQRAKALLPDPEDPLAEQIAQRQSQLCEQGIKNGELAGRLHEAVGREAWNTVLSLADALLELAPEHRSARQARRLAWKGVGLEGPAARRAQSPPAMFVGRRRGNRLRVQTTRNGARSADMDTKTSERPPGANGTWRGSTAWAAT